MVRADLSGWESARTMFYVPDSSICYVKNRPELNTRQIETELHSIVISSSLMPIFDFAQISAFFRRCSGTQSGSWSMSSIFNIAVNDCSSSQSPSKSSTFDSVSESDVSSSEKLGFKLSKHRCRAEGDRFFRTWCTESGLQGIVFIFGIVMMV
ncbi:hypothetical protein F4604DRAFT_965201 [Suillus subluteus]|nr:hypothetical protein F4604DRAFT_965201 [Suillus subluteus]